MIVHVMKGERFMKLLRKRFVTEQQLTEMFKVLRQKPSEIRQEKLQKPKDKNLKISFKANLITIINKYGHLAMMKENECLHVT